MMKTFESYDDALEKALSSITDQQKFFFGVWCCDHLYKGYAHHIPEVLSHTDYEKVKEVMAYLWQSVDDYDGFINEDEIYDHVEALRGIDPEESLLPYETIEGGITNLLGSLEDVASFLVQRDDDLVASGSENIITVIYLRLTNELGLDDSGDPNKHFEHPWVQDELEVQFKLLEQLKEGVHYTGKDRGVLR